MASPLTGKHGALEAHPAAEVEATVERPTLREIFDEYGAHVWRALRHLGVPEADVPDVSQEVFIVVHRKLGEFEGRSSIRTWLYGICLRTASDHRRKAHVRRERATAEPERIAETAAFRGGSPSPPDVRADARAELLRLLDLLDDDRRQVLVLYEIEGLSMKEIAALLDCPLQTAYSRLHAARRQVTEAFADQEQKP